ncbi:hypothetical protein BJV78DRAFT_1281109 [Lactifluus subvellereus]|nr:hypothetical protein BJV78DRAFT_1281109 [Lactifluus subvellereus]
MKFMKILTALSLSALALAAPEAQPQEKRQVGSVISSVVDGITSDAGSIFTDATSLGGNLATKVTSIGGSVFTEVTSIGGGAITLAGSGVGAVTTFGGSVYTVVTGAAASAATGSRNAAMANVRPLQISTPLLAALATTAGGVLLGAWVAF